MYKIDKNFSVIDINSKSTILQIIQYAQKKGLLNESFFYKYLSLITNLTSKEYFKERFYSVQSIMSYIEQKKLFSTKNYYKYRPEINETKFYKQYLKSWYGYSNFNIDSEIQELYFDFNGSFIIEDLRSYEGLKQIISFLLGNHYKNCSYYSNILCKIAGDEFKTFFKEQFYSQYKGINKDSVKFRSRKSKILATQKSTAPVLKKESKDTHSNNEVMKGKMKNKAKKQKEEIPKEYNVQWDDIVFHNGYYTITPHLKVNGKTLEFNTLTIKNVESRSSFNFIKSYFKVKLPSIIITFLNKEDKGSLILNNPIEFNMVLYYIVENQNDIETEVGIINRGRLQSIATCSFKTAMLSANKLRVEDFKKYKSKYIDYLVQCQLPEHKIIPCSEMMSFENIEYSEDAFIFNIAETDDFVATVFENVNPNHSTIFFISDKPNLMNALGIIYSFMTSGEINKRSNLRSHEVMFSDSSYSYTTLNHNDFQAWTIRLENYKNNIHLYKSNRYNYFDQFIY